MRGDYDAWSSAFSSDVEIVHPTIGMRLLGKNDVESVYRAAFSNAVLYSSIKTTRFDVEIAPEGNVAWGTAEAEMLVRGEPQTTWFALVFRKEGDGWKMVLGFDASSN